ncbi:aromatic-ring-hydroxylating dioxygenase subunit beta [Advenella mimigardefordensis]|uniref:Putative aromatic-ring-hydroxylating dioxygenase subunit beta n=1 Tax=Advenella mimigardefordensis (strain DSM 17166 / LMG 22922 / DPN7) TaxID=1247726 RepID=W0PK27_ADVMD|nr:aromatic-ring-hydroxylating dioxygenase subunit beta [Advenella mimigardefordensis]AHG65338.1 putative aromatic-ring-hydroxylating dioxygenase subunit beta [Advenella mimigardefordensis DPN7]
MNEQDVIDFVYQEARLIDELRLDQWVALFTDDGYYWMPLQRGQTETRLQSSLMYEDKLLLKVRVERLTGKRTFSQQPVSYCHHLLQRPQISHDDPAHDPENGIYVVRTAFHYIETRQDDQRLYAGWSTHTLVNEADVLRIRLKKVELVNPDAAFGSIQLFM